MTPSLAKTSNLSVDGKSMLELDYKFLALLFVSTKYKLKRKLVFIL